MKNWDGFGAEVVIWLWIEVIVTIVVGLNGMEELGELIVVGLNGMRMRKRGYIGISWDKTN
jgi:hypothetical protein